MPQPVRGSGLGGLPTFALPLVNGEVAPKTGVTPENGLFWDACAGLDLRRIPSAAQQHHVIPFAAQCS